MFNAGGAGRKGTPMSQIVIELSRQVKRRLRRVMHRTTDARLKTRYLIVLHTADGYSRRQGLSPRRPQTRVFRRREHSRLLRAGPSVNRATVKSGPYRLFSSIGCRIHPHAESFHRSSPVSGPERQELTW